MSFIDGIGDELTHLFVALLVIGVVSLAWWTTSISEQRPIHAVLVLQVQNFASQAAGRLSSHTESYSVPGSTNNTVEEEEQEELVPEESAVEEEQHRIIQTMDEDTTNDVRRRRLAFLNQTQNEETTENAQTSSSRIEQLDELESVTMEHNYANRTNLDQEPEPPQQADPSEIRIKLKYINDDLKIVTGKLEELLGDFKKRNFKVEMATNKLIRLIFNGQVLQQDNESLQTCGLFNNCVVHCLIHTKQVQSSGDSPATMQENSQENLTSQSRISYLNNNNNPPREWDFGNSLFAFISVILLAAWYLRYVYAYLYTVTATIGLILMTGIFTIVLVGIYFPDNENLPDPRIQIHPDRIVLSPQQ